MCVWWRRQAAAGSGPMRQAAVPSPSIRPNTAVEKQTAFGLDADLSADTVSPEIEMITWCARYLRFPAKFR